MESKTRSIMELKMVKMELSALNTSFTELKIAS